MNNSDENGTPSVPTIWHGDGREKALQAHILNLPNLRNKPEEILSEIDRWATENDLCMMTIGLKASELIMDLITSARPNTMAELGGYIGYSAIKFGHEVRRVGGKQYFSLEYSAEYAAVAKTLIEFAGLGDFVQVIVGAGSESLGKIATESQIGIDVLFVDHEEELYLSDLKVAEGLGVLKTGAFVVADNVDWPGAKDYVRWVAGGDEDTLVNEEMKFKYESRKLQYMLPNGKQDAMLITKLI